MLRIYDNAVGRPQCWPTNAQACRRGRRFRMPLSLALSAGRSAAEIRDQANFAGRWHPTAPSHTSGVGAPAAVADGLSSWLAPRGHILRPSPKAAWLAPALAAARRSGLRAISARRRRCSPAAVRAPRRCGAKTTGRSGPHNVRGKFVIFPLRSAQLATERCQ